MANISLKSSELLIYAVLFVGIITALPTYEFFGGETFSKYSTSFPRSPIPLIPDGTTHIGRFVTAAPEMVRVVPLKRYGPRRILLSPEDSLESSGNILYQTLFHRNQENMVHGFHESGISRTIQPTIRLSSFEWNNDLLRGRFRHRNRKPSETYGLPEGSVSPIFGEFRPSNFEEFPPRLHNTKYDELTSRSLPSTTFPTIDSERLNEITIDNHYTTKTVTRKPMAVAKIRNFLRIFGLPDRRPGRAPTIRSRGSAIEVRITPRNEESPFGPARLFGPVISAGPIRALSASFSDDDQSQKRHTIEQNVVGEDGRRRITVKGERLIADEVDVNSFSNSTATTEDPSSDDYADFEKTAASKQLT